MAWIVVRCCAASIALALAGSSALAQAPQSPPQTNRVPGTPGQYNDRIVLKLEQLADQARGFENRAFAVRAQAQAAALLWRQNPDGARSIYRRAFESLTTGASQKTADEARRPVAPGEPGKSASLSPVEKLQLRSELLNQIAARDPALAEDLAAELADSLEGSKGACAGDVSSDCGSVRGAAAPPGWPTARTVREAAERRELLMSAALQIVERDPQQAMAFAQMSVALGISSNLARLLTLLRSVDAERADLLFSNALDRLQQSTPASLNDIHTLGTYMVWAVNSAGKAPVSKPLALRYLNFAINELGEREYAPVTSARRDESATLYFIGRQLADLASRYAVDRLDQVRRYLSDAGDGFGYEPPIDPDAIKTSSPAEIAREARDATDDAQRDSLYARAAIAWLAEGDIKEAHAIGLRIADAATRDRVLAQVSRRYASDCRIDYALEVARRISDAGARVDLLVLLSQASLASRDQARAIELLNEAEACSLKVERGVERSQALIKTACSFSVVDATRSFEVLERAVTAINEAIEQGSKEGQPEATTRTNGARAFPLDQLFSSNLENTLTALARVDFDRALILAQRLAGDEAAVIAQLAVLRGGLADSQVSEGAADYDEVDSNPNH